MPPVILPGCPFLSGKPMPEKFRLFQRNHQGMQHDRHLFHLFQRQMAYRQSLLVLHITRAVPAGRSGELHPRKVRQAGERVVYTETDMTVPIEIGKLHPTFSEEIHRSVPVHILDRSAAHAGTASRRQ